MTTPPATGSRLADFSLATVTAGFVAVLVGFTSSVAVVFQAAGALGATPAQIASWMWALCLGMGLMSALPSWWLRKPVMVAWSTPGAAVLVTAAAGVSMAEATGAFMLCALAMFAAGASGWFERVMDRIPLALAHALLAGVLARFALDGFAALALDFPLVFTMLLAYLIGRRAWPAYAVPGVLACGMVLAWSRGQLDLSGVQLGLTKPVWTTPQWSWQAAVGVALPLFVVTMASQNLPGVAVIRASGYQLPVSRIIAGCGFATLLLAPFGAFALNLAAITAALCMGPSAHADAGKRYTAAVACGLIYIAIGLVGMAVAGVLAAFPKPLVLAVAGLALLGSIGNGLAGALSDPRQREAALVTFLVTASGVVLLGVGSAFWGVLAGALCLLVQHLRLPGRGAPAGS
jgi:benzoate membrane transport protein